jgi:glycerophosphoryl diester phosphodiesterase
VIELGRREGRMLKIGHRGAAALAPENTLEAFRLAVELGCDLVELDVHALGDGLVVVHDKPRVALGLATLDEVLTVLAATRAGIHLDLKARGSERQLAEAVRRHGLLEHTLVSSFRPTSLRALAEIEPRLRLGLTYPQDRTGLAGRRFVTPLLGLPLKALGRALPRRIEGKLAAARATTAVLHWSVVSKAVVERCHALGTPVLAWTVDDPALLRRLDSMGVDGVITNDPRIFGG